MPPELQLKGLSKSYDYGVMQAGQIAGGGLLGYASPKPARL